MGKITFLVTKGETTYDMSELVENATWSRPKGLPGAHSFRIAYRR